MTTLSKAQFEDNCPNCVRYLKENSELKEAFIEADYQSVRQQTQLKDEISKSDEDCSYTDEQLEDAKAEIKKLNAEHSSGNQNNRKVLEQVGCPESNTIQSESASVNFEEQRR
jgi:septal ring factor EnvC (AmiA/AmiB activator)